jgi:hypothetical protein
MRKHGKGPKDIYVSSYGRWQRGHFRRVKSFIRGPGHALSLCPSEFQLSFGF